MLNKKLLSVSLSVPSYGVCTISNTSRYPVEVYLKNGTVETIYSNTSDTYPCNEVDYISVSGRADPPYDSYNYRDCSIPGLAQVRYCIVDVYADAYIFIQA